jgi:hypothetical protein
VSANVVPMLLPLVLDVLANCTPLLILFGVVRAMDHHRPPRPALSGFKEILCWDLGDSWTPIGILARCFVASFVSFLVVYARKHSKFRAYLKADWFSAAALFVVVAAVLWLIVADSPWMPTEVFEITSKDGVPHTIVGYEVAQSDSTVTILTEQDRTLIKPAPHEVKSRGLCISDPRELGEVDSTIDHFSRVLPRMPRGMIGS